MPLRNRRAPSRNRDIVHRGLLYALGQGQVPGHGTQTGSPLPVYHAKPGPDGNLLASVSQAGWDYPVSDGQSLLGLARVRRRSGKLVFAGITHGWLVDLLGQAADIAEKKFAGTRSAIEPRLLAMPTAGLVALWLHGKARDYYIVLAQRPGDLPLAVEGKSALACRIRLARRGTATAGQRLARKRSRLRA